MASQQLSTNTFTAATWIVNSDATKGTHTTLAGAMASASSGDIILLQTNVTENVTITPGVNIVAWAGGTLNTPTITGTLTMTAAGTSTISGLHLKTNSAAFLAITGSAASIVNLNNCYLNSSNATGITFSTSSGSAALNINNCNGDIGTTGIGCYAHSSAGTLTMQSTFITNSGNSTTANTVSAGNASIRWCRFANPLTTSSTASCALTNTLINCSNINTTAFTSGGSGTHLAEICNLQSGTASAVSISNTLTLCDCNIDSTNTNPVTGAGTVVFSGISFSNTGRIINTTTQTLRSFNGGEYIGRTSNTAPSAGMIGEQLRANVAIGSAVSLSSGTPTNINTLSLTAGIWDVSAVGGFVAGAITGTITALSISLTSATNGTTGDNLVTTPFVPSASSNYVITLPSYRVSLSATTNVYQVMQMNYTVGSPTAYGTIRATRVA